MSEFRIFETEEFQKTLNNLSSGACRFVQRKLEEYVYPQLRKDPFLGRNIKRLKGFDPPFWRYRIGKFRVFFMINQTERIIFILSVDDRRDAYR